MDIDTLDFTLADPGDMRLRIAELPQQCRDAWSLVSALTLPAAYKQVNKVVILGMGGSAIGGDLVRSLALESSPVPVFVSRDYEIPAYIDKDTLVIASSYSGNTEETLIALEQAIARGAKCVGVGTGGKLEQRAMAYGLPFVKFSYASSPRAALGYSLLCLAGVFRAAGLLNIEDSTVETACRAMENWQKDIEPGVSTSVNAAKTLALKLYGRLPVVYGSGILSEVARRWKGQFNENSKAWSFFEVMPELNHNAVLGYTNPLDWRDNCVVIMLHSASDHPRVQLRYEVTAEILAQANIACEHIQARGSSSLEQMLTAIHFGDYVSLYLAFLYKIDPTPVEAITYLKERLAKA